MASEPIVLASQGLEAWRRGDFDARDDVMRTLRERYEQGFAMGASEQDRWPGVA